MHVYTHNCTCTPLKPRGLQISTLDIMNIDDPHPNNQSEDELYTSRQAARHCCVALRRYLDAHLCMKAAEIHRTQARSTGTSPPPEVSPYKVIT